MSAGDWLGVGGAAIGGAFGLGGAVITGEDLKEAQESAQEHQVNMYLHRYQWTMRDMEEAGLNPMLAYQQGAGSAASSPMRAGMPNPLTEFAGSAREITKRLGEIRLLKQKAKESVAVEKERQSMAGKNDAEAVAAAARASLDAARVDQTKAITTLDRARIPAAQIEEQLYREAPGVILKVLEKAGIRPGDVPGLVRVMMQMRRGAKVKAARKVLQDRGAGGGKPRYKFDPKTGKRKLGRTPEWSVPEGQ